MLLSELKSVYYRQQHRQRRGVASLVLRKTFTQSESALIWRMKTVIFGNAVAQSHA